MNIKYKQIAVILMCCVLSLGMILAEEIQLKVKTTPDFPEGPPPMAILWDGVQVGTTRPGESVKVTVDLTREKKSLEVGDTKVYLWKTGLSIKGETVSGDIKLKKGPTVVIKSELSKTEILSNAMEYQKSYTDYLNAPDISNSDKIKYTSLLGKIYSYAFRTKGVSISITGLDVGQELVYFDIFYFGLVEKTWSDTLKLTDANFSGKKPKKEKKAVVLSEHWDNIPKYGVLKIGRDGTVNLVFVKTDKYKWGTYKKKKKKKKKYILPITFYAK
ncbi:MAG: hypothetical protein IID16_11035 [Candidatus Marinimicrobia bacterium]|nr:hypothetical protein [Candidatus Neomarinimicrobiota bacterium]